MDRRLRRTTNQDRRIQKTNRTSSRIQINRNPSKAESECFAHSAESRNCVAMARKPLQGKSALVTGGGRRIGREIALALAHAGADILITYKTSHDGASETAREIQALGCGSLVLECDVRSEESVRLAITTAAAAFGRLDIVVNNAAVFDSAQLDSLTIEQWNTVFETNTRGPFLVAREALPYLREARGKIINMGSLGGIHAWAGHGHYCASKAALHMLTLAMAKSFAPEVSVNCVAPGWIEMDEKPGETARRFAEKTPMQRNGTAADVAEAVLFFATASSFVTGQILTVDGGLGLT
jgi:NAD(P)-dependent dehydrogenase (short-subunit alcohol dehydrogenase family)